MPTVASRFPPLQHPLVDPKTGMISRPWAHWIQGLVPLTDAIQYGERLDQPSATNVAPGTLYGVSDENVMERSNGTVWEPYGSL